MLAEASSRHRPATVPTSSRQCTRSVPASPRYGPAIVPAHSRHYPATVPASSLGAHGHGVAPDPRLALLYHRDVWLAGTRRARLVRQRVSGCGRAALAKSRSRSGRLALARSRSGRPALVRWRSGRPALARWRCGHAVHDVVRRDCVHLLDQGRTVRIFVVALSVVVVLINFALVVVVVKSVSSVVVVHVVVAKSCDSLISATTTKGGRDAHAPMCKRTHTCGRK